MAEWSYFIVNYKQAKQRTAENNYQYLAQTREYKVLYL